LNPQASGGKLVEEIELDSANGPEGETELHVVVGPDVGELASARRGVEASRRIGAVIAAGMRGVAIEKRGAHDMSPFSIGFGCGAGATAQPRWAEDTFRVAGYGMISGGPIMITFETRQTS
jgi:hypothetical protein